MLMALLKPAAKANGTEFEHTSTQPMSTGLQSAWGPGRTQTSDPADSAFCSTLSMSLRSDLQRFKNKPADTSLLVVVSACIRQVQPLAVQLQLGATSLWLSMDPRQQIFECNVDFCAFTAEELKQLRVQRVEQLVTPLAPQPGLIASEASWSGPLRSLLWTIALQGSHEDLLPEIAGAVKYRLVPGFEVPAAQLDAESALWVRELSSQAISLEELAGKAGGQRARARRLLNAIYLHSGLIISRAFSDSWFTR
jgi:hypothetical protein